MARADDSRSIFAAAKDPQGLGLCCHTTAVWAFHHGNDAGSVADFESAIQAREGAGDLLLAAQSWHNLGYVHCRLNRPDLALDCYDNAAGLLESVQIGQSGAPAVKAEREFGFVLSHRAFAKAHGGDPSGAYATTIEYLEHVRRTGVHREKTLAYLATAIALTTPGDCEDSIARLEQLTTLPPHPTIWFRHLLTEGRRELIQHQAGNGRRPYLGARLLTLSESGSWCLRTGHETAGQRLLTEAVALAQARGWTGEARRLSAGDFA